MGNLAVQDTAVLLRTAFVEIFFKFSLKFF